MPIFDFECETCGRIDERYVKNLNDPVWCGGSEDCMLSTMRRMPFSSGSRSTFDVRGWNAHNGYGLRWPDNWHDIKMRGLT